jgi:hypothetical protein
MWHIVVFRSQSPGIATVYFHYTLLVENFFLFCAEIVGIGAKNGEKLSWVHLCVKQQLQLIKNRILCKLGCHIYRVWNGVEWRYKKTNRSSEIFIIVWCRRLLYTSWHNFENGDMQPRPSRPHAARFFVWLKKDLIYQQKMQNMRCVDIMQCGCCSACKGQS